MAYWRIMTCISVGRSRNFWKPSFFVGNTWAAGPAVHGPCCRRRQAFAGMMTGCDRLPNDIQLSCFGKGERATVEFIWPPLCYRLYSSRAPSAYEKARVDRLWQAVTIVALLRNVHTPSGTLKQYSTAVREARDKKHFRPT